MAALSWKAHLFAGGVARGVAVGTLFPVDSIKTKKQLGQKVSLRLGDIGHEHFKGFGSAVIGQVAPSPYPRMQCSCISPSSSALIRPPSSFGGFIVSGGGLRCIFPRISTRHRGGVADVCGKPQIPYGMLVFGTYEMTKTKVSFPSIVSPR